MNNRYIILVLHYSQAVSKKRNCFFLASYRDSFGKIEARKMLLGSAGADFFLEASKSKPITLVQKFAAMSPSLASLLSVNVYNVF